MPQRQRPRGRAAASGASASDRCAGALAEIYAGLGGEVVYGGKPHAPIYRLAMEKIESVLGRRPEKSRVLAIGDGLKTDIAGANHQGIDAVFVAGDGGVHEGGADPETLRIRLDEAGVRAMAVTEALRW